MLESETKQRECSDVLTFLCTIIKLGSDKNIKGMITDLQVFAKKVYTSNFIVNFPKEIQCILPIES